MIKISMAVLASFGAISDPPVTHGGNARVIVRCKPEALIRGTSVLMRDLAKIETADADLTARVGDIRIGNRPSLGFNRVFPRADLQRRLITAGLSATQIEMTGASEVVVQPLATVIHPKDITDVCNPVLQAVLDLHGGDVEYEILNNLKALRVPPGRFDLHFGAELRDGRTRPTSATIDFQVRVDDEVFKTIPINYRLRNFASVLTTSRVIKNGELLSPGNLVLQRMEVPPGSNMHLTSYELVAGLVASHDVQNNRTLRLNDIAKPAVVHSNDLVTLVAQRGRIRVTTKAIALTSGAIGDRIQVRSLSTQKHVQAVVHGAGLVEIPN